MTIAPKSYTTFLLIFGAHYLRRHEKRIKMRESEDKVEVYVHFSFPPLTILFIQIRTYLSSIHSIIHLFTFSPNRCSLLSSLYLPSLLLHRFDRWLSLFDRYTGSDLLYFNSQGNIPPEAVQTKGQRRANPFRERKRFDATEFAADASAAAEEAKDVAEEATPAETDDVDEEEAMNKKELEEAEGQSLEWGGQLLFTFSFIESSQ